MATILRGYKTELDLNNQQCTACRQHAGTARWAYNYGLARKQEALAQRKAVADPKSVRIPTAIDLHNEIIALKQGDKPWLKDVSKWTPQQALRNLDTAFDRFFKKQAKYPQPKKRSKGIGSFYLETPIHVGMIGYSFPSSGRSGSLNTATFPPIASSTSPIAKPRRNASARSATSPPL